MPGFSLPISLLNISVYRLQPRLFIDSPTLNTPTIITPTLNTSTVTDNLCNSGAFNNPNAVQDCLFNLKEEAWFLSRSRKFFSYAAQLFLKLFSAAQQNITLSQELG
jgi:hypothetical protein